MKLIDFWPPNDIDHSAKCFFTEAETASPAVFLAVHRPMTLQKEVYGSEGIEPELQTEEDVLEAFLDPSEAALVAQMSVDSGGKSHMIAAQCESGVAVRFRFSTHCSNSEKRKFKDCLGSNSERLAG